MSHNTPTIYHPLYTNLRSYQYFYICISHVAMVNHTYTLNLYGNSWLISGLITCLYVSNERHVFPRSLRKSRCLSLHCLSKGIYVGEVGMLSIKALIYFLSLRLVHSLTHNPKAIPTANDKITTYIIWIPFIIKLVVSLESYFFN